MSRPPRWWAWAVAAVVVVLMVTVAVLLVVAVVRLGVPTDLLGDVTGAGAAAPHGGGVGSLP